MRRRLVPKPELVSQGEIRINNAIVAHRLPARDILIVGAQDDVWGMLDDPERRRFRDWVDRVADRGSFVWLDFPDRDRVVAVEAALKNAGVAVGVVRVAVDAIVAEAMSEIPADLRATAREVVAELVNEICSAWEPGRRQRIEAVLGAALDQAGL